MAWGSAPGAVAIQENVALPRLAYSAAALLLAGLLGCSDGLPRRVPVEGIVLIDGQPVTAGVVRVRPTEARPAIGDIGPDGRFSLTTYQTNDGCVVGTHPVEVFAIENLADGNVRWLAPQRYSETKTSDLTLTVEPGSRQEVRLELTWDGGKSFVQEHGSGG